MITYLILAVNILFLVSANLLLKKGALGLGEIHFSFGEFFTLLPRVFKNPYLLGGLFSYGIGFLLWILVLTRFNVSIVYPVSASVAITLIAIFSYFFLDEPLSSYQVIGIIAVIIGIFLILTK